MNQSFQNLTELENNEEICREAHRICEDVLYSEKARFKMANFWQHVNICFGISTIILSISLVSLAFFDISKYITIVWILSVTTTILSMLQIFFNPYDRSKINKSIGDDYNRLRREIRMFYNISINTNDYQENVSQLIEFVERKFELDNRSSPIQNYFYNQAKKSIENKEHEYLVDKNREND